MKRNLLILILVVLISAAQGGEAPDDDRQTPAAVTDAELDEFEARLKYADPYVAGFMAVKIMAEEGRGRTEALLRAAQVRKPDSAYLWVGHSIMLFTRKHEAKGLSGEARVELFRGVLERLRESYDAANLALKQALEREEVEQERGRSEAVDADRAMQMFLIAVTETPDVFETDREVYDWLVGNPPKGGNYGVRIGSYVEGGIPPYESWLRALRNARTDALKHGLPLLRMELAEAALEAGEWETAKRHAAEWLEENADADPEAHGRIVYQMYEILGRVALREGDPSEAGAFLLKAGEAAGTAGLDTFGPSMHLARELLEKGEQEAVIEYVDLIGKSWRQGQGEQGVGETQQLLERWKADIRAGRIPEDVIWQGPGS